MAIDFLEKKSCFPANSKGTNSIGGQKSMRAKIQKSAARQSSQSFCPFQSRRIGINDVPRGRSRPFIWRLFARIVCLPIKTAAICKSPPTPHAPPLLLRGSLGFPLEGNGISFWQLIYPAKSWTFNTRNFFRLQSTPHFKIRWKSCLRFEKSEKNSSCSSLFRLSKCKISTTCDKNCRPSKVKCEPPPVQASLELNLKLALVLKSITTR